MEEGAEGEDLAVEGGRIRDLQPRRGRISALSCL